MARALIFVAGCLMLASLAAACGGNASQRTPTPYHLVGTPDPTGVIRVPVPRVLAADAGRKDCPADWLLYGEEAFSICYPPDHYAEVWSSASVPAQRLTVRLISGEPVAQTPNALTVWQSNTYVPPSDCYFDGEETAVPDKRQMGTFGLGHTTAEGCLAKLGGTTQYTGVIGAGLGSPESVQYRSQAANEDQFALAKQILGTLVVTDLCPKYPKCATMRVELATMWASILITPTPRATPILAGPDVRPCTSSDLAVGVVGSGGFTMHNVLIIGLGNQSSTSCQLSQPPDIRFLDAHGQAQVTKLDRLPPCGAENQRCVRDHAILLLPDLGHMTPGELKTGQAVLELEWYHATELCTPPAPPLATQVVLVLPDNGNEIKVDVTPTFGGILTCSGVRIWHYDSVSNGSP